MKHQKEVIGKMKNELWKFDEVGGLTPKERTKIKKHKKGLTEEQIKKIIGGNK